MERYPFTLTRTLAQAQAAAYKELANLNLPEAEHKAKEAELIYANLKAPAEPGWQDAPPIAVEEAEKRLAEGGGRNVGLRAWLLGDGLGCIDVDGDTDKEAAFARFCGQRGALVVKTRRGWHIWLRRTNDTPLPGKAKHLVVNGYTADVEADLAFTAKKNIILPIKGTPRAELAGSYVAWKGGKACHWKPTLAEFVAEIDKLRQGPGFEVDVVQNGNAEINANTARMYIGQSKGLWRELFGEDWYKEEGAYIYAAAENAQQGRRNETIFQAAVALGFLGRPLDEAKDRLLKAATAVFGPGDPEYGGGSYLPALRMIEDGWRRGQAFAAAIGQPDGWKPMAERKAQRKAQREEGKRQRAEQQARELVENLKADGALYFDDGGRKYILIEGEAVSEKALPAFCIATGRGALSERVAEIAFMLCKDQLPSPAQAGHEAIILDDAVKQRAGEAWIGLTIVKPPYNELEEMRERFAAFLQGRIALGRLTTAEAEEFMRLYDAESIRHPFAICAKVAWHNDTEYSLHLEGHPYTALPKGVYLRYGDRPRLRNLTINAFAAYLYGAGLDADTEKRLLSVILRHESFAATLNGKQIRDAALASYLLALAEYHSPDEYPPKFGTDAEGLAIRNKLMARSIMLTTVVAFTSGALLVDGPSGSGKTTLSRRLAYLAQGEEVLTMPNDLRDVAAVAARKRVLTFEEAEKLPQDVESYIKSLATGGSYVQRELFTNDELVGGRKANVSIILNTTQIEEVAPDTARRMLRYTMRKHDKRDPKDFKAAFARKAGADALMLVQLAALVWNLRDKGEMLAHEEFAALYGAAWQFMQGLPAPKYDKGPRLNYPTWIVEDPNPELAKTYWAGIVAMGIDEPTARAVWLEARQGAAKQALGGWKDIIELCEQNAEFAAKMAEGMFTGDIRAELEANGYEKDEATSVVRSLARRKVAMILPLRMLGWELDVSKERNPDAKYRMQNKYRLRRLY